MDPIANMLVMIKNGQNARKITVVVPHSKLKMNILELLKQEEYIKTYKENMDGAKKFIEIVLFSDYRINDIKRISKPSKRVYVGVKDITPYKFGKGMSVISTPKGIKSDKEARKDMVGGELLFTIW